MPAIKRYILEDLLNVRRLREDDATRRLTQCQQAVEDAQRDLEQRQQQLADYKTWRIRRENELFGEIIDRTVHTRDLEDLRFRLQKLRDDEGDYEAREIEAQKQLHTAQEDLELARDQYHEAWRERDKLDQHKVTWLQEQRRQQEIYEEKETEDFKCRAGFAALEGV